MGANRKYKSTVFTELFNDAGRLLGLYNALSGGNYGTETEIEINTLEGILFLDMMNDVSFTIGDKIVVLVEHQSTLNENSPLRLLMYIARVYEKIIDKRSMYRQKLMAIPTPELIVLYNGTDEFPDEKELRLSDAFRGMPGSQGKTGSLELTVRVLNINAGRNESIVNKSEDLHGYVTFISLVRKNCDSGLQLSDAVTESVKYCQEHQILQPFLTNHASEVLNMLTTEFKMEEAIEVWKEEGREEGLEKGLERGREEGREEGQTRVLKLIKSGYTLDEIEDILRQEHEG